MKNIDDVKSLLADIAYKGWIFLIKEDAGGFVLTVSYDIDTADIINEIYRKSVGLFIKDWYISKYSTDTEVVRTVHKAVMQVEMFIVNNATFFKKQNVLGPELIQSFDYKNWRLLNEVRNCSLILQLVFDAPDNDNPEKIEEQHCRKFIIEEETPSPFTIRSLVKYAVITAEEHEINEMFKYKGVSIYNPHIDLNALTEFVKSNKFDSRDNGVEFCECGMSKHPSFNAAHCLHDDCPGNNQVV